MKPTLLLDPHHPFPKTSPLLRQSFAFCTVARQSSVNQLVRLAVTLLSMSACSLACAAPYAYTLTGDRFVQMMSATEPLDHHAYMLREKAYSYLDGVRDGAEGRHWCDVNQLKTPDLADELAGAIAKLPASERKKNASMLLLDQLHRRFPCSAKGGKS